MQSLSTIVMRRALFRGGRMPRKLQEPPWLMCNLTRLRAGRRKIANIYCFILLIQWAWILNVAALCHLPIIMSLSQFLLPLYYSIHKTMKNLEVYLHSVEEILDFTQTYYFSFSSPPHLDITYVCMGSQYFPPPCLCDIMWFCGNCGVEQKEELKNVWEPHFNI